MSSIYYTKPSITELEVKYATEVKQGKYIPTSQIFVN